MAEDGSEDAPLTDWQKTELTRLVIRFVAYVSLSYLVSQLAHESKLLPEIIDFGAFETQLWKVALILCVAGYIAGRRPRKDTTPNP